MSGEEHYRQAEACLRSGDLARAQVHATLAQAAASIDQAQAMNWAVRVWEGTSRWGRAAMAVYWLSAGLQRTGKGEAGW